MWAPEQKQSAIHLLFSVGEEFNTQMTIMNKVHPEPIPVTHA